jgi:hypothetical protein
MDSKRVDDELDGLFDDIDTLLKNVDVLSALTERGVNSSLAMAAADALRAYLKGEKARAADDFSMVAEEIASRLAAAGGLAGGASEASPRRAQHQKTKPS